MKTFQNAHTSITVESHIHLISQTWNGVPTTQNYQQAFLASLQLAEKHQVKRWLIDQSQLSMFNPRDLQWCNQKWLPEVKKRLGTKMKIAIVLTSMNQFCKLGADIILRAALVMNRNLESRYFLDKDEARKWLIDNRESAYTVKALTSSATPHSGM